MNLKKWPTLSHKTITIALILIHLTYINKVARAHLQHSKSTARYNTQLHHIKVLQLYLNEALSTSFFTFMSFVFLKIPLFPYTGKKLTVQSNIS